MIQFEATTMETESARARRTQSCARFLKQADAFLRLGNIAGALDAVAAARESDPSNPDSGAYLERIRQLINWGESRDTEAQLLGVAEQFLSLGLPELALDKVAEVLAANPGCEEALRMRLEIIECLLEQHFPQVLDMAA